MRGADQRSEGMFCYLRLEQRVPADHPLRAIRDLVDAPPKDLSRDFGRLYARHGRPSIPPERLLRALLLQAFYTVRSERQLTEQLDYNLLFRWFVGLSIDDAVWDATVFCKNPKGDSRQPDREDNRLYEPSRKPGPIIEAACWALARRKFFDLAQLAGCLLKFQLTRCCSDVEVHGATALQRDRWLAQYSDRNTS